jgi:predicted RNA binding protein YcfA (HicA-like mRNA interferase family)
MTSAKKTFFEILGGRSDANLAFADLIALLGNFGFDLRTKGSHHIFSKDGVREILNLQPKGGMAKPYQVKQVRNVILRYKLGDYDDA